MEKIGAAVYLHLANLEEIKNYTELLAKNNIKTFGRLSKIRNKLNRCSLIINLDKK
ncbi:hypothetical protein [Spiroplasma endosymbiont of Andrena trimmerana]|uniref:hypothetical protein n=1 Tax=Spiroplasma endosymbiont of Andrena trimmerana TaxID=3066316 RepID=UPI0030D40D5B